MADLGYDKAKFTTIAGQFVFATTLAFASKPEPEIWAGHIPGKTQPGDLNCSHPVHIQMPIAGLKKSGWALSSGLVT